MKKASVLALILALGAFTALPALYAEETAAPVVAAETTPSTDMIEGTVKAVTLETETPSVTLTLADGSEAVVGIAADTQVSSAGAASDPSALVEGQKVSVRKTEADGKTVAKTIEILV